MRNGSSRSHLDIAPDSSTATFWGTLDTKTLGGAGFASQRTTGENRSWDVSAYDGLEIEIAKSDTKRYAITLKDILLPPTSDGREQSSLVWEFDFVVNGTKGPTGLQTVFVPWGALKATYRGREQPDAKPLDLKKILRFGLMMRSFFDEQEGEFELVIGAIKAVKRREEKGANTLATRSSTESETETKPEVKTKQSRGWRNLLCGGCGML